MEAEESHHHESVPHIPHPPMPHLKQNKKKRELSPSIFRKFLRTGQPAKKTEFQEEILKGLVSK